MTKSRVIALLLVVASAPLVSLASQNQEPIQPSPSTTPVGIEASAAPGRPVLSLRDPAAQEIRDAVSGAEIKAPVLQTVNAGPRYRVGSYDAITVNFTTINAFDEEVFVKPDGYMSLIGAPDIYVFGDTQPEVEKKVREAYKGALAEPILLNVIISIANPPYFVVGGQVNNPGKFNLHGPFTVAEAVQAAGGFQLATAKHSRVLLFRRVSPDLVSTKLIDLKRILDKADLGDDVFLQSGDFVYVPKNRLSKVTPFLTYFMAYNLFSINFGPTYRIEIGSD